MSDQKTLSFTEFRARVGDREIEGVDLGEDGKVLGGFDLKVLVEAALEISFDVGQ
mgnify:CR=1 FL=1